MVKIRKYRVSQPWRVSRAVGCLVGQLCGDSLTSAVVVRGKDEIKQYYPDGVRKMVDGGAYNTCKGQPSNISEMALGLARMLAHLGYYNTETAKGTYQRWFESVPFQCNQSISAAIQGTPNSKSESNTALSRISPVGIFGSQHDLSDVAEWARLDATITHPNPICCQVNSLFAMMIAHEIRTGASVQSLYRSILEWATELNVDPRVSDTIKRAAQPEKRKRKLKLESRVLSSFTIALNQLLHAPTFEEGIVGAIMQGEDLEQNAAITGALLGVVYGIEAIPVDWVECVLSCKPESGNPNICQPRPMEYWPYDAVDLAKQLLENSSSRLLATE